MIGYEKIPKKVFLRVDLGYYIQHLEQVFWIGNSQFVTYQGDSLGNPKLLQKEISLSETFI